MGNTNLINEITEQIYKFEGLMSEPFLSVSEFTDWKYTTLFLLDTAYEKKLKRLILMDINEPDKNDDAFYTDSQIKQIIALLNDQVYKLKNINNTKRDLEIKKLLNAREENFDFEENLAVMICGDNDKFPYKSSTYITRFFQELGFNFVHDGTTRRLWIADRLKEMSIEDTYTVITQGLFKVKYFVEQDKDVKKAKEEFAKFIDNSIKTNAVFDISDAFNLNINADLLFNQEIKTKDKSLNELIEQARELFVQKNKQLALEKIWDAFERMKTLLEKDKKQSANLLITKISKCLDKDFYQSEFLKLTDIGNNYKIRHFETDKKPIDDTNEQEYLFFRMLSLIDLCLVNLQK